MKVKVIRDAHDTTIGKIYNTVDNPTDYVVEAGSVWVVDDVDFTYILFKDEYEEVIDAE